MKKYLRIRKHWTLLLIWLLAPILALAQSVHGTLTGTVSDSTGAVIVGAKVSIINSGTSAAYSATTTSVGVYRFEDIALGTYTVTVNAPGFRASVIKNVLVQIGTVAAVNVTLEPGAASAQITVTSQGPTLETESSEVGGVIDNKQIVELPLALGGVGALRAAEAFVFLQPATTGPGTANSNNGIWLQKVAGGQNFGDDTTIDGVSQQRSENGSSFDEEAPSVEALDQFKVITSLPEAEYGHTTGGIKDFVTKSGSNLYHGTGFDLYKDQALNANTWFNKGWRAFRCTGSNDTAACRAPYATPTDHKNDYGGSLGGPIRIPKLYNGRDKSFFFFAWEQIHYATSSTNTSTVPTVAERGGNFSDRLSTTPSGTNPCDGSPIYGDEIFDPATTQTVNLPGGGTTECRKAFSQDTISTGFSTVATALLPYWPQPTNDNVYSNYTFRGSAPITDTTYTLRIDHNFNEKAKMWGAYSTRENDLYTSGVPTLPSPVSPTGWWQNFTTHFFRVGVDYSMTPNLMDYVIFGTNRSNSQNYSEAAAIGKDWSSLIGYGNIIGSRNFPQFWTSNSVAMLGNDGANDDNVDSTFQLTDAVVWTHGRHSFKFGADLRMQQYSPITGNSPWLTLASGQTAGAEGQGGGDGFASLLLGEV